MYSSEVTAQEQNALEGRLTFSVAYFDMKTTMTPDTEPHQVFQGIIQWVEVPMMALQLASLAAAFAFIAACASFEQLIRTFPRGQTCLEGLIVAVTLALLMLKPFPVAFYIAIVRLYAKRTFMIFTSRLATLLAVVLSVGLLKLSYVLSVFVTPRSDHALFRAVMRFYSRPDERKVFVASFAGGVLNRMLFHVITLHEMFIVGERIA